MATLFISFGDSLESDCETRCIQKRKTFNLSFAKHQFYISTTKYLLIILHFSFQFVQLNKYENQKEALQRNCQRWYRNRGYAFKWSRVETMRLYYLLKSKCLMYRYLLSIKLCLTFCAESCLVAKHFSGFICKI